MGARPPAYGELQGTVSAIPGLGDLSSGAFRQIVFARLERLEARLGRTEAAISAGGGGGGGGRGPQSRADESPGMKRWLWRLDCRWRCCRMLTRAKRLRATAWINELFCCFHPSPQEAAWNAQDRQWACWAEQEGQGGS